MKGYGPILGLKLGSQKVVVISTHDLVKKVLLQDEFNGRPDGFFFRVRAFGKRKGARYRVLDNFLLPRIQRAKWLVTQVWSQRKVLKNSGARIPAGILFTEGTTWSQCRRFTMRHLRSFGLGQSSMEKQLTVEAEGLVDHLRRASAKGPVPMHTAFDIAVLNSLWCMFAGHRFDYGNEKLGEMLETVHDAFR